MNDTNHTPGLWTPPTYRMGGKRHYAERVATFLTERRADLIVVPFAGFAGELAAYDGAADLVVAERDPGVREFWCVARGECSETIESSIAAARLFWHQTRHSEEPAQRWYRTLREIEHSAPAAWRTIALAAGAISGIWRRNRKGMVNVICPPQWTGNDIAARIIDDERARAAQRWCDARKITVLDDAHDAIAVAAAQAGQRSVVLLVDPPFGAEQKAVLGGWTTSDTARLIAALADARKAGCGLMAWAAHDDIALWERGLPGMVWKRGNNGTRTGARNASPYWCGVERESAERAA